jgi:hypothetical protein
MVVTLQQGVALRDLRGGLRRSSGVTCTASLCRGPIRQRVRSSRQPAAYWCGSHQGGSADCWHVGRRPAGILYLRHTTATVRFVERWAAGLSDAKVFDHMVFNDLVKQGWDKSPAKLHPANTRLLLGLDSKLTVGVLPVASFGNGHTYFIQRLYQVGARGFGLQYLARQRCAWQTLALPCVLLRWTVCCRPSSAANAAGPAGPHPPTHPPPCPTGPGCAAHGCARHPPAWRQPGQAPPDEGGDDL